MTTAATPGTTRSLAERSRIADGKKTRMGMIYAILAGPALGLALGLLSTLVSKPPFNLQQPTGAFAIVALLQVPFGVLGIAVFLAVGGTWRDTSRLFGHRISWWNLFVAVGGFVGDLCYAVSAALIGGALAGPIGGLFGVVGAVVTGVLYREKILRWSTLLGLVGLGVGIWVVLSGGKVVSPTHGVYELVGILIVVGAVLTWGFENFAIAAGTDLMPAEGFIWWRAFLELIIANVLLFALFPIARVMASKVWTDPRLITYGAVIGFGWAIWLIMGYYIGIAYAGGVRGGVLAGTFGFFFIGFFSITVYGVPFSLAIVFGSVIMFVGAAFIVSEPGGYLARKRRTRPGTPETRVLAREISTSEIDSAAAPADSDAAVDSYLAEVGKFKRRRLWGLLALCAMLLAPLLTIYAEGWWNLAGAGDVGTAWVFVGIGVIACAVAAVLVDLFYRKEL
ncbi:MAG: hypothetical protein ACRDRL_15835 [Sciscionella sp.]